MVGTGDGAKATAMKIYRMLVHERGVDAPVELTAEMVSDLRAVDFARQRLAAHPRLVEIEIWSEQGRLCRLQRRTPEPGASPVQLGVVPEDALPVERNAAG
jgi:hypothetical protein